MRAKGVQVIELAFNNDTDTPEIVKAFTQKYKPNFPVGVIDGTAFVKWAAVTPEMRPTVPMVFIIDRKGVIQAQYMGADPMMEEKYQDVNLRAKLMQYLQPGKAGPAQKK